METVATSCCVTTSGPEDLRRIAEADVEMCVYPRTISRALEDYLAQEIAPRAFDCQLEWQLSRDSSWKSLLADSGNATV